MLPPVWAARPGALGGGSPALIFSRPAQLASRSPPRATNWAVAAVRSVRTVFEEGRHRSRRNRRGLFKAQGVVFAVGWQSRRDFASGASTAASGGASELPEKTGLFDCHRWRNGLAESGVEFALCRTLYPQGRG